MTLPRRSLLAAAGLAATSTVWAQGTSPVRIGVLTDMSGPFSANTGTMSVLATRLAVEDFGGSVLGRSVEVISADHQNRPDVGAGIARQWLASTQHSCHQPPLWSFDGQHEDEGQVGSTLSAS